MSEKIVRRENNQKETGYDLFPEVDWMGLDNMDEGAIEDFTNQAIDFLSTEDVSNAEEFDKKLMRLRKALRQTGEANNEFYVTDILAKMYSKLKWSEK